MTGKDESARSPLSLPHPDFIIFTAFPREAGHPRSRPSISITNQGESFGRNHIF
ncbi:MAG: hypothetical protein AAGA60_07750 [Cyanobacteria bacterium P01_E01_bin.42]